MKRFVSGSLQDSALEVTLEAPYGRKKKLISNKFAFQYLHRWVLMSITCTWMSDVCHVIPKRMRERNISCQWVQLPLFTTVCIWLFKSGLLGSWNTRIRFGQMLKVHLNLIMNWKCWPDDGARWRVKFPHFILRVTWPSELSNHQWNVFIGKTKRLHCQVHSLSSFIHCSLVKHVQWQTALTRPKMM